MSLPSQTTPETEIATCTITEQMGRDLSGNPIKEYVFRHYGDYVFTHESLNDAIADAKLFDPNSTVEVKLLKIADQIAEVLESRRSNFEGKKDRKLASYKRLVNKNTQEAENRYKAYRRTADFIPFGQPILIGHHSERRHRRDISRMRNNIDKSFEARSKAEHYEGKIENLESNYAISSDDPDAVNKLERKLADMEKNHEYMKAANKIVKSKKLTQEQKLVVLESLGHTEKEAKDLLYGDFCGRIGYAGYKLSNNNANMKTVRDRIASIKANVIKAIDAPEVNYPDLGLKVLRNAEANRIQLIFNGKPCDTVRSLLKSNGFKWAPSQLAWQRNLNNNGIHAANRVIGQLKNDLPA